MLLPAQIVVANCRIAKGGIVEVDALTLRCVAASWPRLPPIDVGANRKSGSTGYFGIVVCVWGAASSGMRLQGNVSPGQSLTTCGRGSRSATRPAGPTLGVPARAVTVNPCGNKGFQDRLLIFPMPRALDAAEAFGETGVSSATLCPPTM